MINRLIVLMQTFRNEFSILILKKNISFIACLFAMMHLCGQPVLPVMHKGERPLINIDKVPSTAFSSDKIHVKFLPQYRNNCKQVAGNPSGNSLFNIPAVDSLNKLYQIKSVKTLFHEGLGYNNIQSERNAKQLLQSIDLAKALQGEALLKKHQSWGFDLWFELDFPTDVDVKKVLQAYQHTNAFEVVEPLYKASVIGCDKQQPHNSPPPPATTNDPLFGLQWNLHNTCLLYTSDAADE